MENILSYLSDDDGHSSAEEKEDPTSGHSSAKEKEDTTSVMTLDQLVTTYKTLKNNSQSTSNSSIIDDPSVNSTTSDFFNFEAHHIDNHKETVEFNSEKPERVIKSSSGNIEIPSGDFWSDFVPKVTYQDEPNTSKSSETSDEQKNRKRNIDTCEPAGSNSFSDMKNKFSRLANYHYTRPHTLLNLIPIPDVPEPESSSVKLDNESPMPCTNKRKIFYVHSKIAPYLNSISSCQKCKKITKSWPTGVGIINRINWNIPNFGHLLLSAGENKDIFIWNVWSTLDPCVAVLKGHNKSVKHAAWSYCGHNVLSCSYDRSALLTVVETGTNLRTCEHPGFVTAGCFNPESPDTFITGTDNLLLLWDSRMKDVPVRSFTHKDKFGQVQDVVFINGQELVSCSDVVSRDSADRTLMTWDLRSSTVLSNQVYQERYCCTRLKVHPSKQQFLAQSQGGYIAVFSSVRPYKMDKTKRFEGHKNEDYNIGFDISPDGSLVYSGSSQGGVYCYDYRSGRLITRLSEGQDVITDVACHPVLPALVAASTWGGHIQLAGL